MQTPALEITDLVKSYKDVQAVKGVSFSLQPGEFFGFLGPNGAGKTTTISCIVGINTPTSGSIKVFGHDTRTDYREARKKIGFSPQEFNTDPFATTQEILYTMGGYFGLTKDEREQRAATLLQELELTPYKDRVFRALSGGLKRRAILARAMMHNPDLIILDEPTAGVDVELRRELWRLLRELNAKGKTILLTSHYLEEVEALCSRIGIISSGKLVFLGEKSALLEGGKTLEEKYLEYTSTKERAPEQH